MLKIELMDRASLEAILDAMKRRTSFCIVTDDPHFNPLGFDRHSAQVWIGAAVGGILMSIGGGALVLAFLDPEPTSKLGLLVGGGIGMAFTGGIIILAVIVMRSGYTSIMRYDKTSGKYEWHLQPK